MPIRIPENAKTVRDCRIDLIRTIKTLYDRLVEKDGALVDKVKATMKSKDARFAESDLCVAALRDGVAKSTIDPHKLYNLVDKKQITLAQFLDCVTVQKSLLEQIVGGETIEKLSTAGKTPEPSLVTEFKEGVQIDYDELGAMIGSAIEKVVPITV